MPKPQVVIPLVFAALVAMVGLHDCNPRRYLSPFITAVSGGRFHIDPSPRTFHPNATRFAIRWYPTQVAFGPDNDTLLVTLCHVDAIGYCRIARHSISRDTWDVYAFEEDMTYVNPMFSRDGQWIYFTAARLCDNRHDHCDHPRLHRMRSDGTASEMFADVVTASPTLSLDGKRMIYWGQTVDRKTGTRSLNIATLYYLDLETREVVQLTDYIDRPIGRPFLTPDGRHFILQGSIALWREKFGCGPDADQTAVLVGAIADAPITASTCSKLKRFWPDNETGGMICDMDSKGRVLYAADLWRKKEQGNPLALATRPADPNYDGPVPTTGPDFDKKYPFGSLSEKQLLAGEGARLAQEMQLESPLLHQGRGTVIFLHDPSTSMDVAVFDTPSCEHASIAADGSQLSQPVGGRLPGNSNAFAIVPKNAAFTATRLVLSWPRLRLQPTLPRPLPGG